MRHFRYSWHISVLGISIGALVAALYCAGIGNAQQDTSGPVAELRRALRAPADSMSADSLKARKNSLINQAAALKTVGDLRKALALQEWRDRDRDDAIAAIDKEVRDNVSDRMVQTLRDAMQRGSPAAQMAAAVSIGETGVNLGGPGIPSNFGRIFGPDLVGLLKSGNSDVRKAAALALSKIYPDPQTTVPAIAELLKASDVDERRAAADALGGMIRTAIQVAKASTLDDIASGKVRRDLVNVAHRVVSAVAPGLKDSDAQVVTLSLQAIQLAGGTFVLTEVLPLPFRSEVFEEGAAGADQERFQGARQEVEQEETDLQPLANALKDRSSDLARILTDGEEGNRLLAARILDSMAYARYRLVRRRGSVPSAPEKASAPSRPLYRVVMQAEEVPFPPRRAGGGSADGTLLDGLRSVLPALGQALKDENADVRLAVVDTLETLEGDAVEAVPDLVGAMGDCNLFVRWAAARTLGKLGADRAGAAIPGLIRLLEDPDVDVRLAAAKSLEQFGPAATEATAALAATLGRGDPTVRVAAAHALQAIGPKAEPAIPALIGALGDTDAHVRQVAAETLGRFGKAAEPAADALRKALDDENADVRRAASDALLDILPLPKER